MEGRKYLDAEYQRAVDAFARREVLCNVSPLVTEIGKDNEEHWHLFSSFNADQAREPIKTAIERDQDTVVLIESLDLENADDLKAAMDQLALDVSAAECEVYENWIVSDWLAKKLEERGETIEWDFYGLTIWGRCCTGQSILLDRAICDIYDHTRVKHDM